MVECNWAQRRQNNAVFGTLPRTQQNQRFFVLPSTPQYQQRYFVKIYPSMRNMNCLLLLLPFSNFRYQWQGHHNNLKAGNKANVTISCIDLWHIKKRSLIKICSFSIYLYYCTALIRRFEINIIAQSKLKMDERFYLLKSEYITLL